MIKQPETDYKRLLLAITLSAFLVVGWQVFVETPKRQHLAEWNKLQDAKKEEQLQQQQATLQKPGEEAMPQSREGRLALSPRVSVASDRLKGSIALKGLRFDDLTLSKYRTELPADSPPVTLLSPPGDAQAYFAQLGWISGDASLKLPDDKTLWTADRSTLTPDQPVIFRYDNGQGLVFAVKAALDRDYMFTLTRSVENHSAKPAALSPYAMVNRAYVEPKTHYYIMHEGPLGVLDGSLKELAYKELREGGVQTVEGAQGWLGFTDKYWLTALSLDRDTGFKGMFSHYESHGFDRYQAEAVDAVHTLAPGAREEQTLRLFAGAKEIETLDRYAHGADDAPPIPLFDRAVDLGALYFLTKPIFLTLNFFYQHIGNFGVSILLLTVIIKLLMFPLANKGYRSSVQMRRVGPEMQKIRDQYIDDRIKMQQEVMALYKREKINPAAGCLPLLIQIPVFFSLYKVLFVTIEMRHAPFFGWIHDLSAMDPSNIFTLFGLIPWDPPEMLHLGLLPLMMTATMVIQMRQQPTPPDPTQAKVMKFMPYMFLFVFNKMPAGLVLYWTWSNLLSILQQGLIMKRHGDVRKLQPAPTQK